MFASYRSKYFVLLAVVVASLVAISLAHPTTPLKRPRRDAMMDLSQMPVSPRQFGAGLSALGTMIQPLLFMMGLSSFVSMLPQMFQTVMSGVGSNLIAAFTGNTGSSGGSSSGGGSRSRFKRGIVATESFETLLDRALEQFDRELERRYNY